MVNPRLKQEITGEEKLAKKKIIMTMRAYLNRIILRMVLVMEGVELVLLAEKMMDRVILVCDRHNHLSEIKSEFS
ncbi:MAG: hypothetical protein GY710_13720 [Desulfobacteraceae bacterium]|nr:hypothetical protein [Desulfobacteraceae bacterium]